MFPVDTSCSIAGFICRSFSIFCVSFVVYQFSSCHLLPVSCLLFCTSPGLVRAYVRLGGGGYCSWYRWSDAACRAWIVQAILSAAVPGHWPVTCARVLYLRAARRRHVTLHLVVVGRSMGGIIVLRDVFDLQRQHIRRRACQIDFALTLSNWRT